MDDATTVTTIDITPSWSAIAVPLLEAYHALSTRIEAQGCRIAGGRCAAHFEDAMPGSTQCHVGAASDAEQRRLRAEWKEHREGITRELERIAERPGQMEGLLARYHQASALVEDAPCVLTTGGICGTHLLHARTKEDVCGFVELSTSDQTRLRREGERKRDEVVATVRARTAAIDARNAG